ncbi:MAG: ion transporter [Pseudomonadota bacterium]
MADADFAIEKSAAVPKSRLRRRVHELLSTGREGDKASQLVSYGLVALISASVLAVVLESIPGVERQFRAFFFWFEAATVAIFTLEYSLRVWTAVETEDAAPDATSSAWKRFKFMVSFHALVDLVAILPFYLLTFGLFASPDMRFLRAVRLLRVLKLTRYSVALNTLITTFSENSRALSAAFSILIIVMLFAASGIYYFERQAQPVAFGSIPAAMWWAFATLTTVGYGDVTPITVGGKVFGALITVVGLGMVALPTGILASGFAQQLKIKADTYKASAEAAWDDGFLSELEKDNLEKLRVELGLGKATATSLVDAGKNSRPAERRAETRCPHCAGKLPAHLFGQGT